MTTQRITAQQIGNSLVQQVRPFDLDRKHTAGQFLRAHPEALRVMKQQQRDVRGSFSIGERARLKGELQ